MFGVGMPELMIIFVIACVAMMAFMMRGGMMHGGMMHHSRRSPAIDILDERYARGEIDKTEYEERRRLLEA